MLMYGAIDPSSISTAGMKTFVFSSMMENISYPRLNLIPPNNGDTIDILDNYYWDWILSNDAIFIELMRVAHPIYSGEDVYLIMSDYCDIWNDSFLKLLQVRYGIIGNPVSSMDDLISAVDHDMTHIGRQNMHTDIDRLIAIKASWMKRNNVPITPKTMENLL